jgi:membrane fusion protein (multidrug efflux system)
MWSLPFWPRGALFFWLSSGRYVEHRQRLREGRPGLLSPPSLSGLIVEVPVQENQPCLARPAAVPARRHAVSPALAKIESDIEIQRAEIRGLRAQWRTKREDIKAALSQQVYAQADYERQKDLAERKFAPAAKLEESRMSADVAPAHRILVGEREMRADPRIHDAAHYRQMSDLGSQSRSSRE